MNVADIEGVTLWKDIKRIKRAQDSPLGFSLEYNQSVSMDNHPKTLDFVAQTEEVRWKILQNNPL